MIYYFSGTGNSKWVAEELAAALNERLIPIAEAMSKGEYSYKLAEGEKIGWVFPTYSWGPAPIMIEFIKRWQIEGVEASTYSYMVTTCGDDIGLSVEKWWDAIGERVAQKAAYSVQMPNNYILLPGFDVDSHDLETRKKRAAQKRVCEVAESIAESRKTVDVVKGRCAWAKTKIVYPLFKKYSMSDKGFIVDAEKCTHCGLCQKQCPTHNIKLDSDGCPTWHGDCAMCLSCIHRCGPRAIEYGKQTQKKGRYFFKKLR